jgi:hypothetical protein
MNPVYIAALPSTSTILYNKRYNLSIPNTTTVLNNLTCNRIMVHHAILSLRESEVGLFGDSGTDTNPERTNPGLASSEIWELMRTRKERIQGWPLRPYRLAIIARQSFYRTLEGPVTTYSPPTPRHPWPNIHPWRGLGTLGLWTSSAIIQLFHQASETNSNPVKQHL